MRNLRPAAAWTSVKRTALRDSGELGGAERVGSDGDREAVADGEGEVVVVSVLSSGEDRQPTDRAAAVQMPGRSRRADLLMASGRVDPNPVEASVLNDAGDLVGEADLAVVLRLVADDASGVGDAPEAVVVALHAITTT